MWETKETLEGGLRIDRMWWAAVKVGDIVAASVLLALADASAPAARDADRFDTEER